MYRKMSSRQDVACPWPLMSSAGVTPEDEVTGRAEMIGRVAEKLSSTIDCLCFLHNCIRNKFWTLKATAQAMRSCDGHFHKKGSFLIINNC